MVFGGYDGAAALRAVAPAQGERRRAVRAAAAAACYYGTSRRRWGRRSGHAGLALTGAARICSWYLRGRAPTQHGRACSFHCQRMEGPVETESNVTVASCQTDLARSRCCADPGKFVAADSTENPPRRSVCHAPPEATRPVSRRSVCHAPPRAEATRPVWAARAGRHLAGRFVQPRKEPPPSQGRRDPRMWW